MEKCIDHKDLDMKQAPQRAWLVARADAIGKPHPQQVAERPTTPPSHISPHLIILILHNPSDIICRRASVDVVYNAPPVTPVAAQCRPPRFTAHSSSSPPLTTRSLLLPLRWSSATLTATPAPKRQLLLLLLLCLRFLVSSGTLRCSPPPPSPLW